MHESCPSKHGKTQNEYTHEKKNQRIKAARKTFFRNYNLARLTILKLLFNKCITTIRKRHTYAVPVHINPSS